MHKKIALFFGSFNPVHNGHLIIANYFTEYTDVDFLWFIPSPQNPFKNIKQLLPFEDRYKMLKAATDKYDKFHVSQIEKSLPLPSYTINTLKTLTSQYFNYQFIILIGADNLQRLKNWKSANQIISNYPIYVYPRRGYPIKDKYVKKIDAPLIELSSTFIRKGIKQGKNLRYFVPYPVWEIIQQNNFYR